ncbi:MAG: hypothetical protein BGO99_07040 [Nitrosospira sp. 56-18]|jgi:hypothetical protein|nr:MAG: hypothetical protein BGO99_07040 [Nitrosospira sp. 56-18]
MSGQSKSAVARILKHADSNLLERFSQWKVLLEPPNPRKIIGIAIAYELVRMRPYSPYKKAFRESA